MITLTGGGTAKVHRLVATVFIGEMPEALETHHIDGNRLNNAVDNLAYVERSLHRQSHCLGENSGNAKLSEGDVLEIRRKMISRGVSDAKISIQFGVTRRTICGIRIGQSLEAPVDIQRSRCLD